MRKDKRFWIKIAAAFLWLMLILCLMQIKNNVSIVSLMHYKPGSVFLCALFMLAIFVLKSVTFFIYSGLLYMADGLFFELPLAVFINLLGTIIMVTIPYFLGGWMGNSFRQNLLKKYPKLAQWDAMQSENQFMAVVIARVFIRIPGDIVSLYCGACHFSYKEYLFSSILCFAPHMITYPAMGASLDDPSSPQFVISLSIEIIWVIGCVAGYWLYQRNRNKKNQSTRLS